MPIHLATMNGHLEVARLLIDHGADVDASDEDGRTPLHGAAGNCEEQTIRLLIDLCCDVNAQSRNGETPLDAVGSDFFASDDLALRERIRQMLRQAGATESSARRAATKIKSDTGGERVGHGDRFV
ncbi:ankyrin repeat-containing domain protein [Schizophyllum amplum]|uniref:Ankyrin repeat-containing domain protein n=1 Tax=Schizophyllum amplum TaxID=97359 RepID=A0A550BXS1_9AGAR|nr:ankyrin repeat-containing domain protein [Auriculariopsis ampla]